MTSADTTQSPLDRIQVVTGDITLLEVDAIVNAANRSLLGGGGVDGAIHRAAGPKLLEECTTLNGCATGDAKATQGYNLQARFVFHAVGPVWGGGDKNEDALLAACYAACHALAHEHKIQSIAFPAISTGVYGFPKERAARIAIGQTLEWLTQNHHPQNVIFCCFSDDDAAIYHALLGA